MKTFWTMGIVIGLGMCGADAESLVCVACANIIGLAVMLVSGWFFVGIIKKEEEKNG